MNKIVVYTPTAISESVPAFFNKELNIAYKKDKLQFITFCQQDIVDNCIDFNKFVSDYKDFMIKYDLPYVFFPYYVHFNKVLPEYIGLPNPKLEIILNGGKDKLNAISCVSYGFLMLNIKKLKEINFKFNEDLPILYYMQDLIQKCFDNKLWISNCVFIDRHESWKDLKQLTVDGYQLNSKLFKEFKRRFTGFFKNIINGYVKIFGKLNENIGGNISLPQFIVAVNLLGAI